MREYDPAMQVEYVQQLAQQQMQQSEPTNALVDTNQEGDFSTILSSEMISDIVQDYMNKKMYRKQVKVVDLQPTPNGYMFILAYVKAVVPQSNPDPLHNDAKYHFNPQQVAQANQSVKYDIYVGGSDVSADKQHFAGTAERDGNGRFVKTKKG